MRHLIRHFLSRFYQPLVRRYLQRDRRYRYDQLELIVKRGVFHPGLFGSTTALLRCIKNLELNRKSVLDLGCGSGLLGLYAAEQGAMVTAVDIHADAVVNTCQNAERNGLRLKVYQSDLFSAIPKENFDLILVNPPYFEGQPEEEADFAWYAGKDCEYFHRLFASLEGYTHPESQIWMILSEVCDLESIRRIAQQHHWVMNEQKRIYRWWEVFILFRFCRKQQIVSGPSVNP